MPRPKNAKEDKFVSMVSAKAEVDLRLTDFAPRSQLKVAAHVPEHPRFPVIDYHNHLDSLDPRDVLRIMDACGVEKIINITMQTGEAALEIIDRFHRADPARFAAIGWMDWSGLERRDFVQLSSNRLERLAAHGVCGIKLWKDFGLRKGCPATNSPASEHPAAVIQSAAPAAGQAAKRASPETTPQATPPHTGPREPSQIPSDPTS